MTLSEYFAGTAWQVELELDLSVKQQLLDVAIVRRGHGTRTVPWPDGFENPAEHNLLTFKSLKEPLDRWALQELLGHYVNYRKQRSPSQEALLPETHFGLFAATMRFPRDLAKEVALQEHGVGVYDIGCLGGRIRVLVLSQVPEADRNALWNLFSGQRERVTQAAQRLQPQLQHVSSILNELFRQYDQEGIAMPYTVEEFVREVTERQLREMPLKQRLAGLSPEEILSEIPLEHRLAGLSAEEILTKVSLEQLLAKIPLEQLLARLTPEQLVQVKTFLRQRGSNAEGN